MRLLPRPRQTRRRTRLASKQMRARTLLLVPCRPEPTKSDLCTSRSSRFPLRKKRSKPCSPPGKTRSAIIATNETRANVQITNIKLPYDGVKKQQREFAYVDFETEADAQEALKNHEDVSLVCRGLAQKADCQKIRDTTITIVISNPPSSRFGSNDLGARGGRGGGGRGSFRGRGVGRSGSTGGPGRTESGAGDRPAGAADKKPAAPAPAPKKD